jgi:type VI secretion system secreted protein Hcp
VSDTGGSAPAESERIQRFRFRVVAADGRELVSDVVAVRLPPPTLQSQPVPAPAKSAEAPAEQDKDLEFPVSAIFVAVHGQKQGAFKAETGGPGHKDSFAALSLEYEVGVARDPATGHSAGRKQHRPVSISKKWGAASPQLFQALVGNEVLESVEIDCYGRSKDGKEELVHKVKLTNAGIASIRQVGGISAGSAGGELETVAFAFEKIEHMSPKGAVVASDDLRSG